AADGESSRNGEAFRGKTGTPAGGLPARASRRGPRRHRRRRYRGHRSSARRDRGRTHRSGVHSPWCLAPAPRHARVAWRRWRLSLVLPRAVAAAAGRTTENHQHQSRRP
ncbi:unnamed protein product, partial [Ectocarpus sp. 12 AP-2014]